jgi:L-methionine (R)-S-oxide reductase
MSELPKYIKLLLNQKLDRVSVGRSVAEAIRSHGQYRWAGIYDVDMRRGLVSNVAWSGPSAPAYPTFPVTKGLTSRAIAAKRTVNVGDVANDETYLTALSTTKSEIIVPVVDEGGTEVLGTLKASRQMRSMLRLKECSRNVQLHYEGSGRGRSSAVSAAVGALATYGVFYAGAAAAGAGTIGGVFAAEPTARGALAIRGVLTAVATAQRAAAIGRVVSSEFVAPHGAGVRVQSFQIRSKRRHFDGLSLSWRCCREMKVANGKSYRWHLKIF